MSINERIATLVEQGYEARFLPMVEALEAEVILPKELQAKLDKLGDNPISEAKVFDAISRSAEEGKAIVILNVLTEDEIKKFKATDMGNFVFAIEQKITSHRNADGVFKHTPNTEDCKIPNFFESEEIRRLMIKRDAVVQKALDANITTKAKEKVMKDFTSALEAISSRVMEISGLDTSVLTDWEKELVVTQILNTTNDVYLCASGKRVGI